MPTNYRILTFTAGALLVLPACVGLLTSGAPTLISPFPALTVFLAFLLANSGLAVLVPSVFFWLWNPHLFAGSSKIPTRTFALFFACVVLTIIWFVESWNFGLQYQGARFTYVTCAFNGILAAAIGALLVVFRKTSPSFRKALAIHWLLFAWLAWCAFPYLGELP